MEGRRIEIDFLLYENYNVEGYFPAYHMNKTSWITVALDGSVPDDEVKLLLDMSFEATAPKMHKKKKEEKGVRCLGIFECYLIWVNVIGFFLYLFNMFLYLHTENVQVDVVLTICSLLGGSAGILLAILLFDRKAVKDNMMSRVFIACVFVIQVIILLMVKGHHADHITLAFGSFLQNIKYY